MDFSRCSFSNTYDCHFYVDAIGNVGNVNHIEVKTSAAGESSSFYISENELVKIGTTERYCIYRVFNFDIDTKKGELYIIDSKSSLDKYFEIRPINYLVSFKRNI